MTPHNAMSDTDQKKRFADSESRNLATKLFFGFFAFFPIADRKGKLFGSFPEI
jgi:hypothetical protein